MLWAMGFSLSPATAQVNYSVHFEMDKAKYLLGEPIFCRFVIRNTGSKGFAFRYRTPTRALSTDYDQEPRFVVTNAGGARLPDPGPRPCGSPQGTTVYGYVTLPPGKTHTERWLLNQWAVFAAPGTYHVRAERRLALLAVDGLSGKFADKPAAFALAIDELTAEVAPSTPADVKAAFQPYLQAVKDAKDPNPAEAVVVLTSLPQAFFLDRLVTMASAAKPERWDRRDAVDGLARLNTPASWQEILKLFQSPDPAAAGSKSAPVSDESPVQSYALLLLAERGDPAFVPPLLASLAKSADPMRGDILRALGFFRDARANQALFDNLHSAQVTDRMNAVLGLKNLGTKEVVPALLAALNDRDPQVRQVASFALEGVTGYRVAVSTSPSAEEWQRVVGRWHAWWQEHAGSFNPPRPAACHDW
jgi:HEAT repeat protein